MSQKFAGILFMSKIKHVATEVPYNGAIQVATAVASGQLDFAFINYTEAKELAATGRVRMIGVAAKQRLHQDSSIPTFYEQGIDFEHQAWFVLAAPKAMAPELVNKINQSVTSAMKKDQTSYIHREMTPMISTVAQSEQFIRQQYKTYRPIIQGVKSQANK
jgi:tripartite-type tricarboxylate transporter receptor subunit TctC